MSFLSPALLIGLLAALIPPIIHLILRRKPKRVRFAALEFIMRANRKAARRFRIRQFLLMATRSLLLAMVAFAIARPVFEAPHLGNARKIATQGALVLVLDAGFEMGYRLDGETLLDRSRFQVDAFLDGFLGVASVVVAGTKAVAPLEGLTGDLDAIRRTVSSLGPSEHTGSLDDAVALGESMLAGRSEGDEGTVMVFTTPARFANLPPQASDAKTQRLLADIANGQPLPNRAVTAVKVQPAPKFGINHWRIDARIANYSSEQVNRLPVRIEIDSVVQVRGFISLAPGEEKAKSFYIQAKGEDAQAAAVVIDGDALPLDDRRPFWFESAQTMRVLAVNGDPQPTPHLDELFYLERALDSAGATGVQMSVDIATVDQLNQYDLRTFEVIILANPSGLSTNDGRRLLRFVEGGGGLLTTVGNRVVPKDCNRTLGRLLPRPLRSVRRSGDAASSNEGGDRFFGRLGDFNTGHPILAGLGALETGSLSKTRISKYMLVEPVADGGGQVVLSLAEGAPFLVTKELGRGRTALLNGSIDRDWGDLPIRADFLPLINRTIEFLGRSQSHNHQDVLVAQPMKVPTDDPRIKAVKIISPKGESYLSERPGGSSPWIFKKTDISGHYRVLPDPPLPELKALSGVVVSLDPTGSDLRVKGSEVPSGSDAEPTLAGASPPKQRTELWHTALLLLFFLLASEAYLLLRSGQPLRDNMTEEKATSAA